MPRNNYVYSSSDEETYQPSRFHRKTRSRSSSRHRNSTLLHSSSHCRKKWEGVEAGHPLEQGKESMNPDHILIQMQGRGRRTVDLIQGKFTQISITDREQDHLQKQEVFGEF